MKGICLEAMSHASNCTELRGRSVSVGSKCVSSSFVHPLCARVETVSKDIINSLQAPVVDEIIRSVHRAYDDVLPGLPYAELPVIAISGTSYAARRVGQMINQGIGSSMSQGFIADVANRLEANSVEESEDEDRPPSSYITHLYPSDCSNIMSTMKSLVTGFVERPPAGQDGETIIIIPDVSRVESAMSTSKTKTGDIVVQLRY